MAESTKLLRLDARARERSDRERRLVYVARFRWIEANLTASQIVVALSQLDPPIAASVRSVERDIATVRESGRRYLSSRHFDPKFEISAALARLELVARKATQMMLAANGNGARWARAAIMATTARTKLLQDLGMVDRQLGTLYIDDVQRVDRIPSGAELAERWAGVVVNEDKLISDAERHYAHGDETAALAAARDAKG